MTPEEQAALDRLTDEAIAPCILAIEGLGVTVTIEDQEALSDWLQSRFNGRASVAIPLPMKKWRVELTRHVTITERTYVEVEAPSADEAEWQALDWCEDRNLTWSEVDGTAEVSKNSESVSQTVLLTPDDDDGGAASEARIQQGMAFGCEPPEEPPS